MLALIRGEKGETVEEGPVPEDLKAAVAEARQDLVERIADVDEEVAELFICEEDVSALGLGVARSHARNCVSSSRVSFQGLGQAGPRGGHCGRRRGSRRALQE